MAWAELANEERDEQTFDDALAALEAADECAPDDYDMGAAS